jgi:iron complex outermembrane receptor protein
MDGQTLLDQVFGSQASLAPGDTRGGEEKYDISWILEYKGFRFDGIYADRDRIPSIGISPVLNNHSKTPSTDYALNLSYTRDVGKDWNLFGKVYHNYTHMDYYYQVYPENTVLPTPEGPAVWPEGLIGAPSNKNTRTGFELQTTYASHETNTFVAGLTYEYMEQYDVKALSNYLATPIKDVVIPRGGVSEVSHIQNYNQDVDRTFKALYLEDLWDVRANLRLTVGARYDDYSDFGGSFNPRAGLVWEFVTGYDLKLLYGRAFRAPSFYELYNKNNPAFVGNPDLEPETVDTYEISLGAEFTPEFTSRLTGFRNMIQDSIDLVTYETQDVFENRDEIRTQGIEAEVKYDFGKGIYIAMNYTYQDARNQATDEPLYNIPEHKGNLVANIRFSKYINFYTDLYFQEGFTRQKDDPRDDENPGFEVLNATLLARKFIPKLEGLELRGSVYNILDEEYAVPTAKDGLPVDYPMPGRSFLVDIRYTF